jgi:RNA polymerase sigma-70 factor (ECF subfamily)
MAGIDITISINDLQLAQMALKDTRAEQRLFCKVYPRIFKIVLLAVGDRRQAEDIAQVAAMQVFKSLDSFRGLGSIEAWAERIAYRTAMKSIKHEKKKRSLMHFSLNYDDIPHRETPEKVVSRRQVFEKLIAKMERIPKKRRIPLLLHMAYGYTVSEVSEITETSPNTVKARLKTGFRELRTILDEHPNILAAMEEDTQ